MRAIHKMHAATDHIILGDLLGPFETNYPYKYVKPATRWTRRRMPRRNM